MIIDNLNSASMYYNLSPRIAAALEWLKKTDLSKLELGRHDIQGDDCYALVQEYETKKLSEDSYWEAHKKYIDVQYIVSGSELMGYANIESLAEIADYDSSKDKLTLDGDGDFFLVTAGQFVIFAPHDGHLPCVTLESPELVRKVVVKARV